MFRFHYEFHKNNPTDVSSVSVGDLVYLLTDTGKGAAWEGPFICFQRVEENNKWFDGPMVTISLIDGENFCERLGYFQWHLG